MQPIELKTNCIEITRTNDMMKELIELLLPSFKFRFFFLLVFLDALIIDSFHVINFLYTFAWR